MRTLPTGFLLKQLTLTGPSVPASEIRFARGLNVVVGPSDTGKTFIAQCIDFMLGGGTPPKQIPEADGYDRAQLQLNTSAGDELVLERSLSGGSFRLFRDGETSTLGEEHDAGREDTVSHLLLSLTGLTSKRVRTNARGTTKSLSFRRITPLILVNEENVITERSPILSGQHTDRTTEISVFRLLLTGLDDSSLVEQEELKVTKSKQQGRKELLEELLGRNSHEISGLGLEDVTADSVAGALDQAETAAAAADSLLSTERASSSALEEERKSAWEALRRVESRAAVVLELQRRFELLQKQYASDLRRLEAISEAGIRLAQMTEERCPVCGAIAEHHDDEHRRAYATPENVATACTSEAEKIQLLVRDLSATIATNADELAQLEVRAHEHRSVLQAAQEALRDQVEPRVAELVDQLRVADGRRTQLARLADLYRRQDELSRMLEEAQRPVPRAARLPSASVGTHEAEEFSKAAEDLLRSWSFPNLDRVTFSEDDQDLVVSGRKRSSHGKGVRALTHAAFTLALLRYCRWRERPHPGFVVIDSPLVVYREPDSSEDGEEFHVKDEFYRNVCAEFASDQVVILENEETPGDLGGANLIKFTGTEHGRSGFLPRRSTPLKWPHELDALIADPRPDRQALAAANLGWWADVHTWPFRDDAVRALRRVVDSEPEDVALMASALGTLGEFGVGDDCADIASIAFDDARPHYTRKPAAAALAKSPTGLRTIIESEGRDVDADLQETVMSAIVEAHAGVLSRISGDRLRDIYDRLSARMDAMPQIRQLAADLLAGVLER